MSGRRAAAALLALALAGAARADGPEPATASPRAVLDALLPHGRETVALDELADRAALAEGEDFAVTEVGRDARTSHHVVAIRHGETPHRHDRHDLLVVILRGHGTMRLGDATRAVGEGSVLWIPRGTVHAFRNAAPGPAAAYAVYLPPFDGSDRVDVAE